MMSSALVIVASVVCCVIAAAAAASVPVMAPAGKPRLPDLNEGNFAAIRDHILPTKEELKWQAIPWRSSFWNAVTEAQRNEKPILAWMMNGHPLACT